MEPKIANRDSFHVMGTSTRVTPKEESARNYALIWKEFESHHDKIKPHSTDQAYYGVSFPTAEEGVIDYVASMAVRRGTTAAEGLTMREVQAARFAVFECPLPAIGETYRRIFGEWLPQSPYKLSGAAPVFEQYPPEGAGESSVLIHIPIQEKRID